jgi:RNA-binding protein YhbY
MPTKEDLAHIWVEKKAVVRIGKSGLADRIVEEVTRQLKKQRVIKVRFLRTATAGIDVDALASTLAERTGSEVWGRRGSVVVLALRR